MAISSGKGVNRWARVRPSRPPDRPRQAASRARRVTRGELVEDGDLVGQRGEPLGTIAAEILPEPLRYDRQEIDRIGLGAQKVDQRAVEQQANAGLTGSPAAHPPRPSLPLCRARRVAR